MLQAIDRRGSDSLKWGRYAGRDIIPAWVADMDFAAPPAVLAALRQRIAHGVFGYGDIQPGLVEAVQTHLQARYGWSVREEWLVWLPGLVCGLNVACRAVPGDVLTATPVYPPFLEAPRLSGRRLRAFSLHLERTDGGLSWQWDWPALTEALAETTGQQRLLLLCHPHNPVGRAWRQDELARIAELAERHDLLVCSDEIHCDLLLDHRTHRPYALQDEAVAARSITFMAPSKTFNIPGLAAAFAVIPDASLRHRFRQAMAGIVPHVNVLGLVAMQAAFADVSGWHRELISLLNANRDRVMASVAASPGLCMAPVEATYLAWIDAGGLALPDPQGHFERHGLGLSAGRAFGVDASWSQWLRLNFACPPSTLDEILARLKNGAEAPFLR